VTAESLLRAIAAALRDAGIPFMLTGSNAAAYHGVARATMDIDLVIDPLPKQLESFVHRVEQDEMYVSRDAARDALANRTLFNVVDPASGWKVDLIVRKFRPFSDEEFRRRRPIDFLGVSVDVASLEDVVLSKLEWAKLGGSARQVEDVAKLVRLWRDDLDVEYVERWVSEMKLERQWQTARAMSQPTRSAGMPESE
jgi:hypothetical protein